MKIFLKIVAALVIVLIFLVVGVYAWATFASNQKLARTFQAHTVDFPIPFPLSDAEAASVPEPERARAALARAVERGRHLVESRYVCVECHGKNFAGGTMVDAFPMGTILGPNITSGRGSRAVNYRAADWDHIVRHGILPDGHPAAMPSEDFQLMSDQELSDVVSYIRSVPPVDNEVPRVSLGPLGKVLVASGQLPLAADRIREHLAPHPLAPPAAETTPEFGRHLAGICTGCHRENLAGGPIVGGDPGWVPARNLTPHADGLASWTYEQFAKTMREGKRPDGTPLQPPMSFVMPYANRMTEVELQAIWTYLRTVPPQATNK
jgi:mono/diheme cytochrome c family protein